MANPVPARSEALYTLKLLAATSNAIAPLQAALSNDSDVSTEYLARRAWALGTSGIAQPALIDQLQQRQNASDGGYGTDMDFSSHALDSAYVLLAQKAAPAPDTTAVANALTYLDRAKAADGSFATNQKTSFYVTVKALLAAAAWANQTSTASITAPAQQWLLAQRNAAQHFGNSFDNALALWAFTGQSSQMSILQPLMNALIADQLANGSWNNDPYLTAIALRALFIVTHAPPAPTTAAIHGMVVDATNSAALAGVTVQIMTGTKTSVTTSVNGNFRFADVAPGNLTLRFSKLGYTSNEVTVTLTAGQSLNMGTIAIAPASVTISLSGVVKNQSGVPLRDVAISVGTASVLTDAFGIYLITDLSPGAATIIASAPNYQTLSTKVTLVAGTSYTFSPRLSAIGVTPPHTASLSGVVVDSETRQPLVGAKVELGATSLATSTGGIFFFDPTTAGAFILTVSASGYQTVTVSGIAALGTNGLGDIALVRGPSSSTLTGTVTDAVTHQPIAAASVSVQGQGSPIATGVDGKYSITGLNGTSFTLNVAANGYLTQSKSVTLTQAGNAVVDVALHTPSLSNPVISGIVVDASNNMAMVGVAVQILTGTPLSTTTGANGGFAFTSATPGTLTLRFSKPGYVSREFSATLGAGQSLNMGTVVLTPAPLTASLSGVVKDLGGNPMRDVTVAVGAVSVLTDTLGAYQIAGLSPGAATITVSAANYQTVSTSVNFVAGTGYTFSPTLYANGVTPPGTTSLNGVVVDASSKQPLAGATVQLDTSSQTTGADGKFSFNPTTAGAFVLTVSANGYQTSTASGMTVAGVNNVGNIGLALLPVTSTLSGTVTDAVTDLPINAASVSIQGQGAAVVTGADGKYSIAGLTGTNVTINVTATGYQARSQSIVLAQVGAAVVDLALYTQSVSGSDISFIKVATTNPSYPASGPVMLEMLLANSAASNASLLVSAKVFDAQNNIVHEYLANPIIGWMGKTYGNNPVTVAANSTLELYLEWNALQLPAGSYSIKARAVDTVGRVVAEGDAGFDVNAAATLAGGITLTPPITQAGSNQPVGMIANVFNNGNLPIPAGPLQLSITLSNTDNIDPSRLTGSVVPLSSGTPLNGPSGGVFDAEGNFYAANFGDHKVIKTTPAGMASVFATLPGGTNPVDIALDKAGNFYVLGYSHSVIKITPSGAQSTIKTGLTGHNAVAVDANGNLYVTGFDSNGAALNKIDAAGARLRLASNGLSQPKGMVFGSSGILFVTNYGDDTVVKVDADGSIAAFAQGLSRPQGMTRDSADNLYVANSGANNIVRITPAGQKSVYASGLNNPVDVRFDSTGNLFVANRGANAIVKVLPDGSVQPFAQSVAYSPEGMKYDSAGNLYISNAGNNTLSKLDAGGNTTVLSSGLSGPRDIAIAANGDIYVANYANGSISKISNGQTSSFATGLQGPYGLAFDASGTLYVSEYSANRISKIDSSGIPIVLAATGFTSPQSMVWDGSKLIFATTANIYSLVPGQAPVVIGSGSGSGGYLAINNGKLYFTNSTGSVFTLDAAGKRVVHVAPEFSSSISGFAFRSDGAISLAHRTDHRVLTLDANLQVLASYAGITSPNAIALDASNNVFVSTGSAALVKVNADGKQSHVFDTAVGVRSMLFDTAGTLYFSNNNGLYRYVSGSRQLVGPENNNAGGFALIGNDAYLIDGTDVSIRKLRSGSWATFAAGLGDPRGVAVSADGTPYVANFTSSVIAKISNGSINAFSSAAPYPAKIAFDSADRLFVGNTSGNIYVIDSMGQGTDLIVQNIIGMTISGIGVNAAGRIGVSVRNLNKEFMVDRQQSLEPPAVGTVVYQTTANVGELPVGGNVIPVDFGKWTPIYGGDYAVQIVSKRPDIGGTLLNQIHVGPNANGNIALDRTTVPPGDQIVGVQVKVEGADSTRMGKPDVSNLIKSVAIPAFPGALGADAAGNLYTATLGVWKTLKRVTPDGQIADFYTVPSSTLAMQGQVPVDSQQNIYVATLAGDIFKITPNGEGRLFAHVAVGRDSHFTMVINSRDELIVAYLNSKSLIKFAQDGTQSTLATVALPSLLYLAIDGRDNLYVQGGKGVMKISADGAVSMMAVEASFENEGSGIAGDCADNLFLTPMTWEQVGQKLTEERTIAQVLGRNGKVVAVLDGAALNQSFIDMDFIVFDRFGSNLLIWTHSSEGYLYKLPITCGAVSTDLHIVMPKTQLTNGFNTAPKAVMALPDGSIEYVWALKDVEASGQNVAFNTALAALQLGDIKPIASEAFLTFKNSFVPGDIKVPLAIPKVSVGNIVAMSVGTDKPSYTAKTDALINLSLTNENNLPVVGTLTLDITDKSDVAVATVLTEITTIPAAGRVVLAPQPVFNTGDILIGDYKVVAKLADLQGTVLAHASAAFSIVATDAVTAKITSDKQVYSATDTAKLSVRVVNQAVNALLNDSRITTTVKNPDGTVRFTKTEILPQLGQGSQKDYSYLVPMHAAPAGQYSATLAVAKADGTQLAQSSTPFTVSSSSTSGSGLTGTIAAGPKQVKQGETVLLNFSAANAGNSAFTDLPLTLAVVNPDTQTIVKQWPYTTTLEQGKSFAASQSWITTGIGAGNYVAVLSATIGGTPLTLAQDSFQVALPAADVGISISANNPNPKYGDTVALTLTASNAGPATATSVVVTHALPAGLTLMSATTGAGSVDSGAGVWTIGSMASGASATLTISAKVSSTTSMTDSASVTSTSSDPNSTNNSASLTLTPAATASRLTLALLAANQSVAADGSVLLSVTLNNFGPDAAQDLTLKLIPNQLDIATGLPGSGSFDAASGVWTIDNLASSASTTLVLKVAHVGDMAGMTAQVTQANGAAPSTAIQSQLTLNPLDCHCTDVGLNILPSAAIAAVGTAVDWTIVAANRGPKPALATLATLPLPSTLSLVSAHPGQGSYDAGSGQWNAGDLQPGETATLTLRTTVNAAGATLFSGAIQATSAGQGGTDLTPADNSAQASLNAPAASAALSVTQTAEPAAAAVGAPVTLRLTVNNAGPLPATGVAVADLLPAGLGFVSVTASQGSYEAATGLWRVGALAAPASATLTIQATMGGGALHTNGTIVYADQIDTALADNVARSDVKQAQADLAIALHADQLTPKAGQTVTLSVTVNNRGPSAAAAVTVNAMLPNGLSFVSAAPGSGSYSASTGIWTVGELASGASATLVVTAKAATAATLIHAVSVASHTHDPDSGNNSANLTLTVSRVADLGLAVTASTTKPNVGDPVTLTLSVHNSGPSPAQNVLVSDALPSGLSFVSAAASAGSYNETSGTWTLGDLASGAGATLTLTKRTTANAVTNGATVTSTTFDPDSANNSASVTLTPIQPLTGSIAASPKPGSVDGSMLFTGEVGNQGETDLSGVPLTVTVKNATTLATVQQWNLSANIAHGKAFSLAQNWATTGVNPGDYLVVLGATFAGETQVLAQDSFPLIQAVKLDIKQTLANGSRVLVLVSCKDGESEVISSDGKPPVCLTTRTQIIDQALTALGVSHTIVTNESAFKLAFRSGLYNTYWISGKEDKLHDDLAGEIREAVFAGDGMILDGEHDQRNKTIDSVAGLTWKGKIGETDLPVDVTGPLFSTQTLATVGRAQKMELAGSIQQAAFHGSKSNSTGPAVISNTYGSGHAVTFGFDLPFSLQAQGKWQAILGDSLQAVMPAQTGTLTPDGVLSVKTRIANQAKATEIEMKSVLPAGADYLSSTPAGSYTEATRTIAWAFTLAEVQSKDVFLLLQAPSAAGEGTLQTTVATVRNGVATPYGNPLSLSIKVVAATQSSSETTKALQALALTQNKDQKLRDALITALQDAMTAFNKNTTVGYQTAIDKLLDIAERLGGLPVETGAVRLGIDRILKEAQWRWVLAQPPGSP